MSFEDKFKLFKREYDKAYYYENQLSDLTDTLGDVAWELFAPMNARLVECFIGYENEFCLRIRFKNQEDLDTAYNYLKFNNIGCHKHNVDDFILSVI